LAKNNIPFQKIPMARPLRMYQNCIFLFENIPSGNPDQND
jgi:hypothetical protein